MPLPEPDSLYRFAVDYDQPGVGNTLTSYSEGDVIRLIAPTNEVSVTSAIIGGQSRICNWIVCCGNFKEGSPETVWSVVWLIIEQDYLVRVTHCNCGENLLKDYGLVCPVCPDQFATEPEWPDDPLLNAHKEWEKIDDFYDDWMMGW